MNEQREPEHPDFSVEPGQGDLNRANSLLCEALDLDESGQQVKWFIFTHVFQYFTINNFVLNNVNLAENKREAVSHDSMVLVF